jgi:hypothetical protein
MIRRDEFIIMTEFNSVEEGINYLKDNEIDFSFVVCAVSPYRPTILHRLSPMRGSDWLAIPTRSSCACGKGKILAIAFVC